MTIANESKLISAEIQNKVVNNRFRFDPKEIRLSAIGLCMRRQVLGALEPESSSPIPFEYDESGHLLQDALFQRIKTIYPHALAEYEVHHDGGTGHIDVLIPPHSTDAADCPYLIVEVKTMACGGMNYLSEPKESHLWQVKGQMYYLQENLRTQLLTLQAVDAEIIYLCRDHFGEHFRAFSVNFPSKEEITEIVARIAQVERAIRQGEVPPVPFAKPEWQCTYKTKGGESVSCPFYGKCWPEKEKIAPSEIINLAGDAKSGLVMQDYIAAKRAKKEAEAIIDSVESALLEANPGFKQIDFGFAALSRSEQSRETTDWRELARVSGVDTNPETNPRVGEFTKKTSYSKFTVKEKK